MLVTMSSKQILFEGFWLNIIASYCILGSKTTERPFQVEFASNSAIHSVPGVARPSDNLFGNILNPCFAFLSPCECKNSTCCGGLNNLVNVNCYNLPIGVNSVNGYDDMFQAPCPPPGMLGSCSAGLTCTTVTTFSPKGLLLSQRRECCSGSSFAKTNCGSNINCQQKNPDGSYTACCNSACNSG